MLLFVVTSDRIIGAELTILNEQYEQTENLAFNFTKVDLRSRWSRFSCFRDCSHDSSCLGVAIQEKTEGAVRCFKMNKTNSTGDVALQDELVYLKGNILNNSEVKWIISPTLIFDAP